MIPHCDELFFRFFDRWYTLDAKSSKPYKATRPDMEKLGSLIRAKISDVQPLTIEGQQKTQKQLTAMFKAAREDWQGYLSLSGEPSLEWIEAFDRYYDCVKIAGVIERSDPGDLGNDYVVICCELGAFLGELFLRERKDLQWLYEVPYWEPAIMDCSAGWRINVFHWAIKKMSDYAVDDGLAGKLQAAMRTLTEHEGVR